MGYLTGITRFRVSAAHQINGVFKAAKLYELEEESRDQTTNHQPANDEWELHAGDRDRIKNNIDDWVGDGFKNSINGFIKSTALSEALCRQAE